MNQLEELLAARDAARTEMKKKMTEAGEKKISFQEGNSASKEYLGLVGKANADDDAALCNIFRRDLGLKGPSHFSKENVFVWGGPTPYWGGSMAKDTSVKAAEWFGFDNVMYVYGPLNEEMVKLHEHCGKLICHLGTNCRTPGAAAKSDVEEAELLSRLSLKYKNIAGGVVDDMIGNCGPNYSRKQYQAMHDALKKHNPALELYGVVYTHELDRESARLVSGCIDHPILWVWDKNDLCGLDLHLEKCRALFPGKPIMLGVFMFDYVASLPNTQEAMEFHLAKAKKYLSEGKVQDIVILGDREIAKCPAAAEAVRKFFRKEFQEAGK